MTQIVAKFGGTSVKTASSIRRVANIIKANNVLKIIVVSAAEGVTNLLVKLCHAPKDERAEIIAQLHSIHLNLAHELDLSIDAHIEKKIAILDGADASNPEKMDIILALGEDLSSLILHSFLKQQGVSVTHVDIRNYLITDDHFGKAAPDLATIKTLAESWPDGLCITQGFIGSTKNCQTTTLGRGGSDYSAALMAEAINANELLIYTDVTGVYTMDPNIEPSAHLITELSFQEMAEIANFGAKILHPSTLEPCFRAKIPVRILSSFEPEKTGTSIGVFDKINLTPRIRAITMRKNQILVTIKSINMLNNYGFLASIFNILAKYRISVDLITTSEISIALTVDEASLNSHEINPFTHNQGLIDELSQIAEMTVENDLTLLAVIGSGLTVQGITQKTLHLLAAYTLRLICYGASASNIGILVPKEEAAQMARILHQELLGRSNV